MLDEKLEQHGYFVSDWAWRSYKQRFLFPILLGASWEALGYIPISVTKNIPKTQLIGAWKKTKWLQHTGSLAFRCCGHHVHICGQIYIWNNIYIRIYIYVYVHIHITYLWNILNRIAYVVYVVLFFLGVVWNLKQQQQKVKTPSLATWLYRCLLWPGSGGCSVGIVGWCWG